MAKISALLRVVMACAVAALVGGLRDDVRAHQAAASACRTYATTFVTKHTGKGFSAEGKTTCQFDRATIEFRCANEYSDSTGGKSTTSVVTKYASIADVIEEVKVVPPLRRALSTTSVVKGTSGTSTVTLTSRYDAQGRLMADFSEKAKTTYGQWDPYGRPTFAREVSAGGTVDRTIAYMSNQVQSVVTAPQGGTLSCTQVFDTRGIEISTSCLGPMGSGSSSRSTTGATAEVCK